MCIDISTTDVRLQTGHLWHETTPFVAEISPHWFFPSFLSLQGLPTARGPPPALPLDTILRRPATTAVAWTEALPPTRCTITRTTRITRTTTTTTITMVARHIHHKVRLSTITRWHGQSPTRTWRPLPLGVPTITREYLQHYRNTNIPQYICEWKKENLFFIHCTYLQHHITVEQKFSILCCGDSYTYNVWQQWLLLCLVGHVYFKNAYTKMNT